MIHIDGREWISNTLASAAGQHVCMGHKFGVDKDKTRENPDLPQPRFPQLGKPKNSIHILMVSLDFVDFIDFP
jgi:hypothetical protein